MVQCLHYRIFTSKGSYMNAEPKNVILVSVQKAYFPLRGCKLPGFMLRRIGPTMEFIEIQGYLSTWYRVCTKAIFTSKGSYGNAEPKTFILLSVQKAYFKLRGCKLYPGSYIAVYGRQWNLPKFWASFPHGTVFALR